ncbi:MAG: PKD domain-containing protein, partial [Acidimicrobiia bacterium]|nr:PKD domain-containing protein [Acidimicrobiia bacterium]
DGAPDSDTTSAVITVPNVKPTANANGPYSGNVGQSISFSSAGSSDSDGTIVSYSWNFGDGGSSTAANPTHSYSTGGTKTVTLTVTDNDGAPDSDTTSAVITVPNVKPTANANGPYSGNVGQSISFSSAGSSDPESGPLTYLWNFGDGGSSTAANPTHTYTSPGNKNITLTVTDNKGAPDSDTTTANINAPPTADAGGPYSGQVGNTISVNGSGSSDSDGTVDTYSWDWGDDSAGTTTAFQSAIHTFTTSGTFTITLTVTDNGGATDSDTATVNVAANQAPTVAITTPTSGAVVTGPLTVRIEANDQESGPGTLTVQYRIDATGVWQTTTYNAFTQRYENTIDTTILVNGPHSITARATDGSNNTSTSPSVTFVVDTNQAPSVRITSPIIDALVAGSTTISVAATDDKAVSRVEFFVDGVSIGTDASSAGGWNVTWDTTKSTRGRHTLTATAADVPGKTGTSPAVSVTVDQLPTVDITAPRNGAVIEERVIVTALATDDAGIAKVEFLVDGSSIGIDTNSAGGWRISWNTRGVNNGRRTLRAVATDTNGQTTLDSIIVTVDNDLVPAVTITGPGDGATIFGVGVVLISAKATDDDGVEQVEFFVDGTSIGVDTIASNGWSAIWNPTRATIGSHTVRAVATDTIGQTAADSNEVTIQQFTTATTPESPEETATTVAVETAAEGLAATAFSLAPPTVLAGGEIALTVVLAANIPGKADVQFLLDGQPLGETATVNAGSASVGTGAEAVFTRTLPTGMQIGLHRVEVVTTEQPPRTLASRTIGVVAGAPAASDSADPAPPPSSTPPGMILAIAVGGAAALAAAGFAATGWYRRKMIVRRLVARGR